MAVSANIVSAKTETYATSRLNATPRRDLYRPQGKRRVKSDYTPRHHVTSTLVSRPRHLMCGAPEPRHERRQLSSLLRPGSYELVPAWPGVLMTGERGGRRCGWDECMRQSSSGSEGRGRRRRQ